ncbi:sulfatase-like hydrolase/transferase [Flavivirga amylovorans]|uniref:Sulfatase-like hydrolase/transferase n=1 Tax=Flavivirga amylovorans TaxID=870486 RepID=A0ABT8WX05_9FLAO|nr:sulfatase-like hydrolase/transferase [Flavivirga amylovorans]MDO5986208.1 sulfatase-like hydrolase/transferase [Flavivirga amylovorans]
MLKKTLYLLLCSCLAGHLVTAQKLKESKPNVILFLVDDMGVMDTSVPFLTNKDGTIQKYPLNNWYRTPNMQKLANMGTRFSTFYAQSVCSPTRISILTGQNATRHKTTQWINPELNNRGEFGPENWQWQGIEKSHHYTLPQLIKANGYETIFIGKAHLGSLNSHAENPLNLGFNFNIGGSAWGSPGSYYGTENYTNKKKKNSVPHLEHYHNTDTFLTEALTREANKKITEAVAENKPFFLEMSHYAVHRPFMFDERFKPNYDSVEYSQDAFKYATLVEGMDKSLGDILNHLEALGIAENTLILFVGDNGSDAPIGNPHDVASSSPLRGKKGTHFEGGTRVPFIAAWAKTDADNKWQKQIPILKGTVQQSVGTVMDIYPTILDILNIETPKDYTIDGYSLREVLTQEKTSDRIPEFLMHFPHEHRSSYFTSYRFGDWKLIYHYFPEMNPSHVRYELYNLLNDPYESVNQYKKEPKVLEDMMALMIQKLETEEALFPIDKMGLEAKPFLKI